MNKNDKEAIVSQIKELLTSSSAVYLVDYSTTTVAQISAIRKAFRNEGVTYKVFKNSLFTKAIDELGQYEKFKNILKGMTGFAFVQENVAAPAKLIQKFNTDFKKFEFKGCYIGSDYYGSEQLTNLASMPTKEEIMASIVGSIAAPASGIVGAINAVMRDLVCVIDEISKQKAA